MESNFLLVMVTVPSAEVGEKIALHLINENLAACVNLLPSAVSFYRWEGKQQKDEELLLLAKTRAEGFETQFISAVKALHPYDLPEIIALPIIVGSKEYLEWIDSQTRSKA